MRFTLTASSEMSMPGSSSDSSFKATTASIGTSSATVKRLDTEKSIACILYRSPTVTLAARSSYSSSTPYMSRSAVIQSSAVP